MINRAKKGDIIELPDSNIRVQQLIINNRQHINQQQNRQNSYNQVNIQHHRPQTMSQSYIHNTNNINNVGYVPKPQSIMVNQSHSSLYRNPVPVRQHNFTHNYSSQQNQNNIRRMSPPHSISSHSNSPMGHFVPVTYPAPSQIQQNRPQIHYQQANRSTSNNSNSSRPVNHPQINFAYQNTSQSQHITQTKQ